MRAAIAAAVLGVIAITAGPAPAEARVVLERTQLKGHGLYAEWVYQEGDIVTFVALVATAEKSRTKSEGKRKDELASLNILRGNLVTGVIEVAGAGYTEEFDLDLKGNLQKARFRADVIFQDDSTFTFFDLHIDVTLDATGPIVQEQCNDHFEESGQLIKVKFDNRHREAVATGTVFGRNEEFTPFPSTAAHIHKNKNASVTIEINPPPPQ